MPKYTSVQLGEIARKVLASFDSPETMQSLLLLAQQTGLTVEECYDKIQQLAAEGSM